MDAWSLLTPDEQSILSSKIECGEITAVDGMSQENSRDQFNTIVGSGTDQEIKNMVTLVRNFIDTAGGRTNSAIWREIKTFNGVWLGQDIDKNRNDPRFHEGGGVIFNVKNKITFLGMLEKNGYAINTIYDRLFNKKAHPNDSAREITETSMETGAHMTNDDSSDLNMFFLHWDRRSTEFRKAGQFNKWRELIDAGKTHSEPFTASEVRERLRRRGVAPEDEA